MMYREYGTGDFIFTSNDDDRDEAIKELGKMDSDYCDKVYKGIVVRLGYVPDEDEEEDILNYIWNFSYEDSSHQFCRITCPKYPEIEDAVKRYFDEWIFIDKNKGIIDPEVTADVLNFLGDSNNIPKEVIDYFEVAFQGILQRVWDPEKSFRRRDILIYISNSYNYPDFPDVYSVIDGYTDTLKSR